MCQLMMVAPSVEPGEPLAGLTLPFSGGDLHRRY